MEKRLIGLVMFNLQRNKNMKRYYTDWKTISITIGLGLAIFLFGLYSITQEKGHQDAFINAALIAIIPISLGVLLATRFSYAEVSGNTLKFVYLLFYKRTIDIHSVTEINDQPTYKAGKSMFRSLYIFYKDNNGLKKWVELRISIFPEKALGRLIKDLKAVNPSIELNKYSEKLKHEA